MSRSSMEAKIRAFRSRIAGFPAQDAVRGAQILGLIFWSLLPGCGPHPRMLPYNLQVPIDRSLLRYPPGFAVQPYIRGLSAPTSMAWDPSDGSLLVAEGGNYDQEPRILAFHRDGRIETVYPYGQRLLIDIGRPRFEMYGPIGGMIVYKDRIYVSHRDENGLGRITAIDRHGGYRTVVANLPTQGDYSVTDLAIDPVQGRLFFGVGAATNSSVVGLDNWQWVQDHPKVHDLPLGRLYLRGYRFDSPNPFSGLFGPADIARTGPFQPFNVSDQSEVEGKELPNAAIYSCSPDGGGIRVEAHGIRCPRGIAYNGAWFFFTNEGMELRGTRPVKNDPDALLRLIPAGGSGRPTWYGWPDYTTDLQPVYLDKFQPPQETIARTGYQRVLFVIDEDRTIGDPKTVPLERATDSLVRGVFAPLSGAAKLDFAPVDGPFKPFARRAVVALCGDRAPFDTSGYPIFQVGYKVVLVDWEHKKVEDFVSNTAGGPASRIDPKNLNLLERPVDVKFGPDGTLYILDAGRMQVRDGRDVYEPGTGQIFRLVPTSQPAMFHNP